MELPRDMLVRARAGDREAQAAFVATYQARVFAICVALAGPDAEDCAQDALVAALQELRRFDPEGEAALGTYVLRIARNRCVDRNRSARVRTTAGSDVEAIASDAERDAERQLVSAREAEAVRMAILELPLEQRAALALREWGGLDYEAIAAIENVPVGTIRSRIARAKDALRERLVDVIEKGA
jgi:RNA polymerase sigma-70 factor (ECF subfamily)